MIKEISDDLISCTWEIYHDEFKKDWYIIIINDDAQEEIELPLRFSKSQEALLYLESLSAKCNYIDFNVTNRQKLN